MLSNFKLMEVLWKKIDKKGFNIVFSDKYKVGLFIKEAKIALRVLKIKFLKKAKLMGFFQSRGLPKTLMLGESLTAYVICKTSGTLLKRVPLRFYYFFRLFFFRSPLKAGYFGKKGYVSNIPLRQSLNDYFFSPSFYSKLNKNSR